MSENTGEKLREIAARLNDLAETFDPPKPPTLREKVADHIAAQLPDADLALITYIVDQALPFLADEMTKRPLVDWPMSRDYCCEQRAADVAWLRGEQS